MKKILTRAGYGIALIFLTGACTYILHCPTYESHYKSYHGKHPTVKKSRLARHYK